MFDGRVAKKTATSEYRRILERIQPGRGVRIKFPGDQPFNRVKCAALNGIAYSLWGNGAYSIRAGRGECLVIRKASPAVVETVEAHA